ncbi:MAG: undecaprenyl-diphosphate phosphatase [Thermoleophilia bacterium]|nr:undecaprenyl-diphosphate phosphatase [Thermoleophilia bacterium]
MSWFQAVILGITQGLTEFLPISSSAHLRIVPAILGWDDPGARFTAIIQLGTMLAVVLYFGRDLLGVISTWTRSWFRPHLRSDLNARMGWYLVIGTIPIVIGGFAFKDQIETGVRSLYLMGVTLIVFGIILGAADWLGRKERPVSSVGRRDAIWVGLAQALALIPGVSRSGATITMGLIRGLDREAAARFSFLLSIPAIVLSGVYELYAQLAHPEGVPVAVGPLIIATIVSFIVGYASIAFLLKWLARHTLYVFVVYRIALGLILLALAGAGVIS